MEKKKFWILDVMHISRKIVLAQKQSLQLKTKGTSD